MIIPLFHVSVVVLNAYTLWYDQEYLDYPFPSKGYAEMSFKARSMFLTLWCFVLQTVYFSISLLNDVIGTDEQSPKRAPLIRVIKDILFSVAFPTAIYVSFSFWALYYFDKEMIFPEYIERIMPNWVNQMLHLFVAVFMFIELLFTRRNYPKRRLGLSVAIFFNVSYVVWMHMLHAWYGAWSYPLLEVMNLPTRLCFIVVSLLISMSLYVLGEKLSSLSSKLTCGSSKKKQR